MISIQHFRSVGTPTDRKNGTNPYQQEDDLLNSGKYEVNGGLIAFAGQFDFYPNPNIAGGQLNMLYNLPDQKVAEIRIIDMIGQLVQKVNLSENSHQISFSLDKNIAAGTYKVILFQDNKLITVKKLSIGN